MMENKQNKKLMANNTTSQTPATTLVRRVNLMDMGFDPTIRIYYTLWAEPDSVNLIPPTARNYHGERISEVVRRAQEWPKYGFII